MPRATKKPAAKKQTAGRRKSDPPAAPPTGPITVTLMDPEETRVVGAVEIPEVVPILEYDGAQFEPVRPETWGHWIYRQLTK